MVKGKGKSLSNPASAGTSSSAVAPGPSASVEHSHTAHMALNYVHGKRQAPPHLPPDYLSKHTLASYGAESGAEEGDSKSILEHQTRVCSHGVYVCDKCPSSAVSKRRHGDILSDVEADFEDVDEDAQTYMGSEVDSQLDVDAVYSDVGADSDGMVEVEESVGTEVADAVRGAEGARSGIRPPIKLLSSPMSRLKARRKASAKPKLTTMVQADPNNKLNEPSMTETVQRLREMERLRKQLRQRQRDVASRRDSIANEAGIQQGVTGRNSVGFANWLDEEKGLSVQEIIQTLQRMFDGDLEDLTWAEIFRRTRACGRDSATPRKLLARLGRGMQKLDVSDTVSERSEASDEDYDAAKGSASETQQNWKGSDPVANSPGWNATYQRCPTGHGISLRDLHVKRFGGLNALGITTRTDTADHPIATQAAMEDRERVSEMDRFAFDLACDESEEDQALEEACRPVTSPSPSDKPFYRDVVFDELNRDSSALRQQQQLHAPAKPLPKPISQFTTADVKPRAGTASRETDDLLPPYLPTPADMQEAESEKKSLRKGHLPSNHQFRKASTRSDGPPTGPHFYPPHMVGKTQLTRIQHASLAQHSSSVVGASQDLGHTQTPNTSSVGISEHKDKSLGKSNITVFDGPCPLPDCDNCIRNRRVAMEQSDKTNSLEDRLRFLSSTQSEDQSEPAVASKEQPTETQSPIGRPGQPGFQRRGSPHRSSVPIEAASVPISREDRLVADLAVDLPRQSSEQKPKKKKKSKGKKKQPVRAVAENKPLTDTEPESDAKEEGLDYLIAMKRKSDPKLAHTITSSAKSSLPKPPQNATCVDALVEGSPTVPEGSGSCESKTGGGAGDEHPVEDQRPPQHHDLAGSPVTPTTSTHLPAHLRYGVPNTPSLTPKKLSHGGLDGSPRMMRTPPVNIERTTPRPSGGTPYPRRSLDSLSASTSPGTAEATTLRSGLPPADERDGAGVPEAPEGSGIAGVQRRPSVVRFADNASSPLTITNHDNPVSSATEHSGTDWIRPKSNGHRSRSVTSPPRPAESYDRDPAEEGRIETHPSTGQQRVIFDGPRPTPPYDRTVFCANIPSILTENQTRRAIVRHFQRFEDVERVHLVAGTGYEEAHAFVVFKHCDAVASIINSPAAAAFWAPTSTTNDGRREYQLRLEPTSSHRILVLGINRDQARKVFTHPQSNEVLELHRRLPPCVAFERYLEPIGYDPVGRPKFRIGLRLDLRQVQIGFVQEQRELDYRRRCPVEVLPDPIRVNLAQTDTEIEIVRALCEPFGQIESITANHFDGATTHAVVFSDRNAAIRAQPQLKLVDGVTCFWPHKPLLSRHSSNRSQGSRSRSASQQEPSDTVGSDRRQQDRRSLAASSPPDARSSVLRPVSETVDWPTLPKMKRQTSKALPADDTLEWDSSAPTADDVIPSTPSHSNTETGDASSPSAINDHSEDTSAQSQELPHPEYHPPGPSHATPTTTASPVTAPVGEHVPVRKRRSKPHKLKPHRKSPRWSNQHQNEAIDVGATSPQIAVQSKDVEESKMPAAGMVENAHSSTAPAGTSVLGLTDLAPKSTVATEEAEQFDAVASNNNSRMTIVVENNLDSEETVRSRFKAYGRVVKLDVTGDDAIVTFSSVASAREAVKQQRLEGNTVKLLLDNNAEVALSPAQPIAVPSIVDTPRPPPRRPSPLALQHDATPIHAPKPSRLMHILHEDNVSSGSPTPPYSGRFRRRFSDPGRATPKLEVPAIIADDSRSDGATVIESTPPSPVVSDAGSIQMILVKHRPVGPSVLGRSEVQHQEAKSAGSSVLPEDVAAKLLQLEREVEMYKRLAQMHGIQNVPPQEISERQVLPLVSPPPIPVHHISPPSPHRAQPLAEREMDGRHIRNKTFNLARSAHSRTLASPRPVRLEHREDGTLIPVYEHQDLLEYRRTRSIEDARGRYGDQNQEPLHRYPVQTGGHSPKKRGSLGSISVHELFGLQKPASQGGYHHERLETPVNRPIFEAEPTMNSMPMGMMGSDGVGDQYASQYNPESGYLPHLPYHTGMLPAPMYSDTPLPEPHAQMPPFPLPPFPAYQNAELPTPFGYNHHQLPFEHGHLRNSPRGPSPYLPPLQSMSPITAFRPHISPHKGGHNNRNANQRR